MAKDTVQDTFKAQSSRMICSISNKMMLATRHCPAPPCLPSVNSLWSKFSKVTECS